MALQPLSRAAKIIYGSGDTGLSLTSTVIGAYLSIFLTDVVGLAPAMAAAAIFVGRSWDWVNDPIIGYLSDRTRTRWGRRRPYLLFGALPFALAFTLMWWKPPWSGIALALYYTGAYILYDTAATFVYMPFYALTPELAGDYDERTSLTSYRMFFSILASLAAFVLPGAIIGAYRPENGGKIFNLAAGLGLVSALPLFLVFFGTRERKEFAEAGKPRLGETLAAVIKNKPLLLSLGIYLFTWVAMDLMQTILLYFVTYCVNRQAQSQYLMGAIFITAMLVLPFWNWAARRWGKKAAYISGVAFWAAVQLVLMTLGPGTSFALILSLCVLAGVGIGAAHVLPWSILPDAVEWDEWKTGERHEGTFYSFVTVCQKIASTIAVPLALLLLEVFGYRPGGVEQGPQAVFAIRLITGPIPAILLSLGILCAVFYPISRTLYATIVKELSKRRAKGEAPIP